MSRSKFVWNLDLEKGFHPDCPCFFWGRAQKPEELPCQVSQIKVAAYMGNNRGSYSVSPLFIRFVGEEELDETTLPTEGF